MCVATANNVIAIRIIASVTLKIAIAIANVARFVHSPAIFSFSA